MTLPAPAANPPTVLPLGPLISTPLKVLAMAKVPVTSVPMKLPRTWLPWSCGELRAEVSFGLGVLTEPGRCIGACQPPQRIVVAFQFNGAIPIPLGAVEVAERVLRHGPARVGIGKDLRGAGVGRVFASKLLERRDGVVVPRQCFFGFAGLDQLIGRVAASGPELNSEVLMRLAPCQSCRLRPFF